MAESYFPYPLMLTDRLTDHPLVTFASVLSWITWENPPMKPYTYDESILELIVAKSSATNFNLIYGISYFHNAFNFYCIFILCIEYLL